WRAVAIHVRQLLIRTHPADVPSIMRLWYIRLVALVRLKLYEFANSELMKISNGGDLDNPALRYEAYPDVFGANKSGPMVTFELRAFWARLPSFKGNHHESINRMYTLLYTCRTMIRNAKTEASPSRIWHARAAQLQLQIANLLLDLKDHRAATGILRALVSSYPTDAPLACALGRLYLQLGNTPAARALFDQPRFRSQPPNSPLNLLNKAFLYIAEGDFQAALSPLTALLAHHSDPSLSSTSPPQNVPSTTHALNNLALAHLYTGNVVQAVSFLDSTVIEQPATAGVCPPLLFNLSSLYDLCDATLDRKRRLVAHVVAKYAGDDFDTSCLKL
ncbi:uncharacterized protein EV422DRAFT_497174, partial [Fimicolochytrium jonesii]|uniref:uncharacterized protein n=1 Tax=Fimicolochytrium jonesii TaxID=1396493 RepID=UPI0022FE9004